MEIKKEKAIEWIQEELDISGIYHLSTLRWADRIGLTPKDLEKLTAKELKNAKS